jgi:hypothetical protein
LLLDNCEHLIATAAQLAEAVMRACPRASILVTSRELLKIEGEEIYRVPPLAVPAEGASAEEMLHHSAVQLFITRMRSLNADVARLDLATVASICRQLDGIPLAIEFAAARAATLDLDSVLARLSSRFDLLTSGRRTALPQHQTLRATLDWSYEMLSVSEKALFRALGNIPCRIHHRRRGRCRGRGAQPACRYGGHRQPRREVPVGRRWHGRNESLTLSGDHAGLRLRRAERSRRSGGGGPPSRAVFPRAHRADIGHAVEVGGRHQVRTGNRQCPRGAGLGVWPARRRGDRDPADGGIRTGVVQSDADGGVHRTG